MFELEKLSSLKGAVSSSCSTVIGIRAAVPVEFRAAATRTCGLIRATLLDLGHLHQLGRPGLKGAVSGSGSTDGNIITAEPIGFRAATTSPSGKAVGLFRATLLDLGHLHQRGLPFLKGPLARAFSGSFSTKATRAAVPVGHWAAAHRAVSCFRRALLALGKFDQSGLPSLKGAVSGSGSTIGGIRAAEPVGHWAAASRAISFIRTTLLAFGQLCEFGHLGIKPTVSRSGSTVYVIRTAEPVRVRAAASRAIGCIRVVIALLTPGDQLGLFGFNLETRGQCHKSKAHSKDLHL